MREYRRVQKTEKVREAACVNGKDIEKKDISTIVWVLIVAAVLIGFLIVPAFKLELNEIPKAWLVIWCTLLSCVVTKLVNFGM